ncbi:MAG: prolyl oligopeptidase family serine peptidase, partial [Gemmatimonadetes bacterium]|nr:S9 family peptidase [Gemmatimonadota bacterium]NIR76847.1 S9 family peptidase [Gemmatimonadota bacterium]NIT85366.1 S9 family peptidase [Gemmatimonadota bacterium]NIU29187.1 S9 family peptidase [Gemmatimonadota bacterium]NIU34284.1 prolyl oligopeptidase family serine peptidase [Gemmatimonadota bacterium]
EEADDPRISPDGSRVIYTRRWVNPMTDDWESALWIVGADGTRNRHLVDGTDARWAPDGTRILYTADGEPEGTQVFVRWMEDGGTSSQVTRVTETPEDPRWSPDGTRIAFRMLVPRETAWPIDLPAPPEDAEWTEAPRIVDRIHFREDGEGFLPGGDEHLFVVPADGGSARQITSGAWSAGDFDWTPDGSTIVFDGNMDPDADAAYRESYIHAVSVESGRTRTLVGERGPWANPRVSPDGRTVAYTGYPWTVQTYKADELWTVDLDGSRRERVSGDFDRSPDDVHWATDGSGLYFTAEDRGAENVFFADLDGGVRPVTEGAHVLSLGSVARNGTAVGIREAPQEPGDVVRYDLHDAGAGLTELTHVNDDVLDGIALGEVEEIWYESTDGTRIQGWIVKPPDFDPSAPRPLILHIHGGPHGMYDVGFSYSYQNFAANGYVVLYTNPRGSTGYGTDFGNAIDNGYPSVDYDDLMAGVDAVIERGWVNTDQMYVTGCSGGGVLSSWVIGHTDRFAAAGVRCPVINWMSFAGTADIVVWGYHRYEGYPWTNPEKYLEHSPLMYAGNVTTPTLLMTGVQDLRTPMSQTEEYYQALKQEGVPVRMLRFNEEDHGTGDKPSNFMRTQLYLMKWFEEHGGEPGRVADEPQG